MHVKSKPAAFTGLVMMMVTGPCLAAGGTAVGDGDRAAAIDALGGLSLAPQLCGIAIDRDALDAIGRPYGGEVAVDMFRAQGRLRREQASWTAGDKARYCEASAALARKLGVYRDGH
jgi:hypothetical protein